MSKPDSTINFCYFLYNFPKSIKQIIKEAFQFDVHLVSKWQIILDKNKDSLSTSPIMILEFIMQLSDGNKAIFIKWIEKNYNHKN
jgi:hypothetical protein